MFFKVNGLYILQVCLPRPGYFSVVLVLAMGICAMTYYVISCPKQSDDSTL